MPCFSVFRWKDIRSGSRAIITYLSIADFFTAFGYIFGSLNYYFNFEKTSCSDFLIVCEIQSFITSTSSLSSFFWTCSLAIYLYVSLVHNKVALIQKFFPAFHVINWGLPLLITFPVLATGHLGLSYSAVSTWCFIEGIPNATKAEMGIETSLVLVAGKLWEIMTYIIVIVFCLLIKRHIAVQVSLVSPY